MVCRPLYIDQTDIIISLLNTYITFLLFFCVCVCVSAIRTIRKILDRLQMLLTVSSLIGSRLIVIRTCSLSGRMSHRDVHS